MLYKKNFSILSIHEEKNFLKKKFQEGLILEKIDYQGYYFSQASPIINPTIVIEFFYSDYDGIENFYESQGFELIYKRKTDKGVWLYYLFDGYKDYDKREDDFSLLLADIGGRLDVFWLVISGAVLVFSIFMALFMKKKVFLLLGLASLGITIYLTLIKKNIRNMMKKLN